MQINRHQRVTLIIIVTLALIHAVLASISFAHQIFVDDPFNDMPDHVDLVILGAQGNGWPGYSIYHRIVYFLSGFSDQHQTLAYASITLLVVAAIARVTLITTLLADSKMPPLWLALVGLATSLSMPLFNWWKFPSVYLGQITPTIWHNPTTIVAMPLALGLFIYYLHVRENLRAKSITIMCLLLLANLCIKPNYPMVFAPVLYLDQLWINRKQLVKLLPSWGAFTATIVLIMVWQYLVVFTDPQTPDISTRGSAVLVQPFLIWQRFTPSITASLALSLAFPLVASTIIAWHRSWTIDLTLAWCTLAVAVFEYSMLVENTYRLKDGNFGWGCHLALVAVFVISAKGLWQEHIAWPARAGALAILALHLITGITYYVRSFDVLHPYWA